MPLRRSNLTLCDKNLFALGERKYVFLCEETKVWKKTFTLPLLLLFLNSGTEKAVL